MSSTPRIIVLGAGSVGRRHANNLRQLGAAVSCFDPREDRRTQATNEISDLTSTYPSFDAVMADADHFAGAVIASPPSVHVDQSIAMIERDIPLLLEKPIAPDLSSALRLEQALKSSRAQVLLGYTYRWWPPIIEMKKRLGEGRIGTLRHARFVMSAHLADWHPWESYQDFFMAHRELGGGALLDESHFLDLMIWFFGMPESITGRVEHLSSLEINTDDNVDLVAVYPDGLRVTIHLDLFGRPHEKSITVVGEEGTLHCGFAPDVVRWSSTAKSEWQTQPFICERNDMFLAEAKEFLGLIDGSIETAPRCALSDGIQVLQCVEAARMSTKQERTIRLESCLRTAVS